MIGLNNVSKNTVLSHKDLWCRFPHTLQLLVLKQFFPTCPFFEQTKHRPYLRISCFRLFTSVTFLHSLCGCSCMQNAHFVFAFPCSVKRAASDPPEPCPWPFLACLASRLWQRLIDVLLVAGCPSERLSKHLPSTIPESQHPSLWSNEMTLVTSTRSLAPRW